MQVTVLGYDLALDADRIEEPRPAVRRQVREYDRGERSAFELTVSYPETFTGRVMASIADIPHGETRTYGDLAADLGTAPVAVGAACGANPVPLVVPCHRVVGADSPGGFSADAGVKLKRALLAHERDAGALQADLDSFA